MRLQWLVVLFNKRTETHLNVSRPAYSPDTGRMKSEPDQINTTLSRETMRNIPQKEMLIHLGWGGRNLDAPRYAYVIDRSERSALVGFAYKHLITHSLKTNGCLEGERQGYRKFQNETTGAVQPTPLGQNSRWILLRFQ